MQRSRKTMITALLVVALSGVGALIFLPSHEPKFDSFRKAHEAFNMGEFSDAAKLLEPLAQSGDTRAARYVGIIEAFGLGRPINRNRAKKWIAMANEESSLAAGECSIGIHWANGHFGTQNVSEAAYWINYSDQLRGKKFCLNYFQGRRLPKELQSQIHEAILELEAT